jgi:c-di-GMP-binding flagellar brake protein YcgR
MSGENPLLGWTACGRLSLEPGLPLMMQTDEASEQFKAFFVGMQEDLCLVVRLPLNVGVGWQLSDGSQVTTKFLSYGTVYGFHSEILGKYFKPPLRFLFLSCPSDVEKVEIRKHFRVNCLVPATVVAEGGAIQGMVNDIGLGGLRFVHHYGEKSPPEIKNGDTVTVRCLMLGLTGVQEIVCQVRNAEQNPFRLTLGLGFGGIQAEIQEAIRGYVNRVVRLMEDAHM